MEIYSNLNVQLPNLNGLVVETNPTLANATGSSTNAILMGNSQQSKASLFYVAPYICKNKVALDSCLQALNKAQQHIDNYPSAASNSGTDRRTVQHLFTRVLNQIYSHIEVSDSQAALSLLNMGCEITSDTFAYFGADHNVNFLNYEMALNKTGQTLKPLITATTKAERNEDPTAHDIQPGNFGTASLYKVVLDEAMEEDGDPGTETSRRIPVHYPMHYRWRGEELADMTKV
jgi:hypothetical protein